ncbi:MAG: ferrochelatase [Anaerolinea sp.]|nr:ferrochelatase [Anaerolinea sp.]
MLPKAVLMMAYGGPGSLEDVEPYLLNVRGGRVTSSALLEEIKGRYAAIGGKSPLLEITRAQARALQDKLDLTFGVDTYKVFVGMRNWFPYIREAVGDILHAGYQQVVAICMTPYFSRLSTQAYFDQLDQALAIYEKEESLVLPQVIKISSWHANPLFIQALAEKLEQGIQQFPEANETNGKIIFTAHSLPAAIIDQGDPYEQQLRETAQSVAAQLDIPNTRWEFCFQSAGARNTSWLEPSLEETLARLAQEKIKHVLVAPIGFVSDHVETLFDIDIEVRQQAQAAGIHLERMEALNTSPGFIEALEQIIKLRGIH